MRKRGQKKNRQKGGNAREKMNEKYRAGNEKGYKLKEERNNVKEGSQRGRGVEKEKLKNSVSERKYLE